MTPYYEKIRNAADEAALALTGVAESCRGHKTPMDTANALRTASLALQAMAEEFESMAEEFESMYYALERGDQ